jgi:hypothetical protein
MLTKWLFYRKALRRETSMNESLQDTKRITAELLQERIKTVRTLKQDKLELYEIAKDEETGEHYLHYAYVHRNIAAIGPGAGAEEEFHHLMPLESDDVLGYLFSEQPYSYPEHWHRAYLRNGPEGEYVWFDPGYIEEHDENEALGHSIVEELMKYKQSGERSEETLRKLLESLDEHKDKK